MTVKYNDLSGQKFGHLTVIRDSGRRNRRSVIWECRCECGNECLASALKLKDGGRTTCGECSLRHGGGLVERFNKSYVVDESGCWIWTKCTRDSKNSKRTMSYGCIHVGDRSLAAHRVSYELFVGPIPPGMLVCHACDVPKCVNPDHLWLGTYKDNFEDMIRKGRGWGSPPTLGALAGAGVPADICAIGVKGRSAIGSCAYTPSANDCQEELRNAVV